MVADRDWIAPSKHKKKAEPSRPGLLEEVCPRAEQFALSEPVKNSPPARLFWQRGPFNLKGKDLFGSLYSKNHLFANLSEQ